MYIKILFCYKCDVITVKKEIFQIYYQKYQKEFY
jgi:hypothetical protein